MEKRNARARALTHKEPMNRVNESIGEVSAAAATDSPPNEQQKHWMGKIKTKYCHLQTIDQPIGYAHGVIGDDGGDGNDDDDLWICRSTFMIAN